MRTLPALVVATLCCHIAVLPAQVPTDVLYIDGFEALQALRMDNLALRDPHTYRSTPPFGCLDVTSVLNNQLATQFSSDADADGFLDRSPMQLFRGLRSNGEIGLATTIEGRCTAPVAGTTCTAAPGATPVSRAYAGQAIGICLGPLPGTVRPYNPAVPQPAGPCFVTAALDQSIDFGGVPLAMRATTYGASRRQSPTPGLSPGLMRGFVSEAVANAIILPPEFGGGTLASVLPGGSGNCAAHDDRDQLDGVSGWWFYLEYTASDVPYAE